MSEINPYEAPQSELSKMKAQSLETPPRTFNHLRTVIVTCSCQALALVLAIAFGYAENRAALVFGAGYFMLTFGLIIFAAVKRAELLFYIELLLLFIPLGLIAKVLYDAWPEL